MLAMLFKKYYGTTDNDDETIKALGKALKVSAKSGFVRF